MTKNETAAPICGKIADTAYWHACQLPPGHTGPHSHRVSDAEARSAAIRCHCGREVEPRDPDPWEGRMDGYCEACATARCDCYPDECPVKYPVAAQVRSQEVQTPVEADATAGGRNRDDVPPAPSSVEEGVGLDAAAPGRSGDTEPSSESPAARCSRCNDSGVIATLDGEAMECPRCKAGEPPAATTYPSAITGTWSDLEASARYTIVNIAPDTAEWEFAEAVLVLLGETERQRAEIAELKERLGYPRFAR